MDDLISREAALAAISDDKGIQYPGWWYKDKLRTVPGAKTEPPARYKEAADILLRCLDVIDYEDYAELIPGEHKAMELAVSALMGEGKDESDT